MIVTFLIYTTATGEILTIGDAEDTDVPTLPGAGESYLISDGSIDYHQLDGTTSRVVGGVVVSMTPSPIVLDTPVLVADYSEQITFSNVPNPNFQATCKLALYFGTGFTSALADRIVISGS